MSLRLRQLLLAALVALACWGCSNDDEDIELQERQIFTDYTFALFDPLGGDPTRIPLPNDLLRDPDTGQNAVPSLGDPAVDTLVAQFNSLNGFSTSGPLIIPMEGGIQAETVNAQTLLVVDLEDLAAAQNGQTIDPIRPMSYQVTVDPTTGNPTIFAYPVRPLKPGRTHAVVMTNGVIGDNEQNFPVEAQAITLLTRNAFPLVDDAGRSQVDGLPDGDAAGLEPLRQLYQPLWEAAEAVTGLQRSAIPLVFSFTTQNLFGTMTAIRSDIQKNAPAMTIVQAIEGSAAVDGFFNLIGAGDVPHDAIGAVYIGAIQAPRWIGDPETEPFAPGGPDGLPLSRGDVTVPFIACMPLGAQAATPMMIFQHAITRSKEDMFGLANGPCSNGVGVIGIDMWLHGDLTFGLDLIDNATGFPGPDGIEDPSGANFVNLGNLLLSRDNIRQSVSNLYTLTRMITSGNSDFNGDGGADAATFGLTFFGQSLGGVSATSFVATETNIGVATLNVTGGRIASLLRNSQVFGPQIAAGLGAFGIPEGSFLAELYFFVGQTILDDADGFNYGAEMTSGNLANGAPKTVLLQMSLNDDTIPNDNTIDLARAIGVRKVDGIAIDGLTSVNAPYVGSGLFTFDNAGHGSLLDPSEGSTVEMQVQGVTFLLLGLQGTPTVINPFQPGKQVMDVGDGLYTPVGVMNFNVVPPAR